MADDKDAGEPVGRMSIDGALVRELAELLSETGLTEIEVADGARRIRVARQAMAASPAPVYAAAPASAPAPGPALAVAPAPAAAAGPAGETVKSPMVGTVYLAAEPTAANFASVGQVVKRGDTLVIIEAMKVMNPITAPAAGTITAVLVDNGQPVEYDQPLVIIG